MLETALHVGIFQRAEPVHDPGSHRAPQCLHQRQEVVRQLCTTMSGSHRADATVKHLTIGITLRRMHAGDFFSTHEKYNEKVTVLFADQAGARRVEVLPQVATCITYLDARIVCAEKLDEPWYLGPTELLVAIPSRQRRGIRDVLDRRPSFHHTSSN